MGLREWYRTTMVKPSIAAHARGDAVYVHRMPNAGPASLSDRINRIEAVGWTLEKQEQARVGQGNSPRALRWVLTFRRI